jgi:hypothetical protein
MQLGTGWLLAVFSALAALLSSATMFATLTSFVLCAVAFTTLMLIPRLGMSHPRSELLSESPELDGQLHPWLKVHALGRTELNTTGEMDLDANVGQGGRGRVLNSPHEGFCARVVLQGQAGTIRVDLVESLELGLAFVPSRSLLAPRTPTMLTAFTTLVASAFMFAAPLMPTLSAAVFVSLPFAALTLALGRAVTGVMTLRVDVRTGGMRMKASFQAQTSKKFTSLLHQAEELVGITG